MSERRRSPRRVHRARGLHKGSGKVTVKIYKS